MTELAFDPNGLASTDNIFGLPFTPEQAQIVLIPVPWEVTVSYRAGTAAGPAAILQASRQVDLFEPLLSDAWKIGLSMLDLPENLLLMNELARGKAEAYISMLEQGADKQDKDMARLLKEIDQACQTMNSWVEETATYWLEQGKIACLVGGDHSTPLGLFKALAKKHGEFGILHFDAHADLRDAYEGFEFSHASIMFNALKIKELKKLVQVGIRDYCQEEYELIAGSNGRITTYFDRDLKARLYSGENYSEICQMVVNHLPEKFYVSFDVDGLDPKLCPNTGTPVPGGLEMEQALYMVQLAVQSGKTMIGFDVNEVAPGPDQNDEWDANVGARLLYRLANLTALSNKLKAIV